MNNQKKYLIQICSILQRSIEFHTQGLHAYRELESKGLRFNKLRILVNAISEIARETEFAEHVAAEQLFKKIEKMNGVKLRPLEDDLFITANAMSVSTTISERVNLYFGSGKE